MQHFWRISIFQVSDLCLLRNNQHWRQMFSGIEAETETAVDETSDERIRASNRPYDSESQPYGAHTKRRATVGDLDDDLGHGIFATWLGVAATLAGVSVVGLFVQHRMQTNKMKMISDMCAWCAALIVMWDLFVFFGFRRRHWTAWILGLILVFFVVTLFLLIYM